MSDGTKLVIVAAMEREISGLVQGWESRWLEVSEGGFRAKCWTQGDVAAVAVGTGWERATFGTKVAIETFHPELITSVGYAGSHTAALPVGSLLVPAQVLGFKNGLDYRTGLGEGILFTAKGVVSSVEKAELKASHGALAVDMEAAAVAEVARANGVRFGAVKAISDGLDDRMEFLGAFVTPEGFKTGAFLAHIAIRPWLWGAVARLGRNSQRAAETLTTALQELAADTEKFIAKNSNEKSANESSQSTAQLGRK